MTKKSKQQEIKLLDLYPLPETWEWVAVKDAGAPEKNAIVDGPFGSNLKVSDYVENGPVPVLTTKNLDGSVEGVRYISQEKFEELIRSAVYPGDILMAKIGSCGKMGIYPQGRSPAMIPANLLKVTLNENFVLKYVFYYFNTSYFQNQLKTITKATAQPAFGVTNFRKLPLPFAPKNEQKRIVAEIEKQFSRLDEAVDNLKRVKSNLKRYKASVLKAAVEGKLTEEWRKVNADKLEPASVLIEKIKVEKKKQYKEACEKAKKESKTKPKRAKKLPPIDKSELHQLPESWEWVRIGDISINIHYGYTALSDKKRVGPKMLRITDIQNNSVNWEKVPYCRIDESDKGRYLLKEGDLVFARTGATVGKSFLIKGQIPESVFASYLIRIILPSNFNNLYLYQFFQSALYWKQITEGQVGIGQPNVNGSKLSELFFSCPSYEEQNLIAQEIESRLSIADNLMKEVEAQFKKADSLRQSILKKAFEGKLIPQDAGDEPVEELFNHILLKQDKVKKSQKR